MPQRVEQIIERIRNGPATIGGQQRLAGMLRQDARQYKGLSLGEADLVRGHVLASFEHSGLPAGAVHVAKEELRTSLSPVVLAGAARAVRSIVRTDAECRDLLVAASRRIALRDEVVRLDPPDGPAARTAQGEIAATLGILTEAPSSCCCGSSAPSFRVEEPIVLCPETLSGVVAEDQSEQRFQLARILTEQRSLVAFFYTRCMNPAKCSLTITRLAELARRAATLEQPSNFSLIAISYDPDFDSPSRLFAFGRDRLFPFDENTKLVRCVAGWTAIRRTFGLQVGYNDATVNGHARELFIVSAGKACRVDCERLSDPDALLEHIRAA